MQPGLLGPSDVMAFTWRVLVDGVQRPVLSVSFDRALRGVLPSAVVALDGVTQAKGSIEWASGQDVADGSLNPWNPSTGWIPRAGQRVKIFASNGTTEWQQFDGLLEEPSGSIGGGLESTIIDDYDKTSAVVDIPPLIAAMPPLGEDPGTAWKWRRIGVQPSFHLNAAARAAGFYSTPPTGPQCVLDVPMQGSMLPLVGDVREVHAVGDQTRQPYVSAATWGESRGDFTSIYEPSYKSAGTVPVQLSLMRAPTHAGVATVRAEFGSEHVALRLTATQAQAIVNGATVATINATGSLNVSLLLKNGAVTLRGNEPVTATGSATWSGSATLGQVKIDADADARIFGVQVDRPQSAGYEFVQQSFKRSFVYDMGDLRTFLTSALPARSGMTAAEVLDEISQALLIPLWIDEFGVLQAVASDRLWNRQVSRGVSTAEDIRELSWAAGLLGERSRVEGSYQRPVVAQRAKYAVTVWESSESVVLLDDESHETIIEPGDDEEWIMVDPTPSVLGLPGWNPARINQGDGSLIGAVYTDGENEYYADSAVRDMIDTSFTALNKETFRLWTKAKNLEPGWQIELRTLSTSFVGQTSLWPFWWGKDLPLIRAKARVTWVDLSAVGVSTGASGPVYEHDFGPWATGGVDTETSHIDALLGFIADQMKTRHATIESLRVGYDPRLQLGDVILVESPDFMGVTLRCLITSLSVSARGAVDMTLGVRIIGVATTFATYEQFAKAWGNSADYTNFSTAWGAISTYADFTNDPLRGAPNA